MKKKENYSIKLKPETKRDIQKLGAEFIRDLFDAISKDQTNSDAEIDILILKNELQRLDFQYQENSSRISEIDAILKRLSDEKNELIQINNDIITISKKKNEVFRSYVDRNMKQKQEIDTAFQKLNDLLENKEFENNDNIELEIQEIILNCSHIKSHELLEMFILDFRRRNISLDFIRVLENCR